MLIAKEIIISIVLQSYKTAFCSQTWDEILTDGFCAEFHVL